MRQPSIALPVWFFVFWCFGCSAAVDARDPGSASGSSGKAGSAGAAVTGVGGAGTSAAGSGAGGSVAGSAGNTMVAGAGGSVASGGSPGSGGCLVGGSGGNTGGGPATGEPGVWENVTPAGMTWTDGFGLMDVIVDPVRPSDLYAFVTIGTGVWKSTDYGVSWALVSTGTLADVLTQGRQWTAAIDPNPGRDPSTPPTLYTSNGYGPVQGVFKSTDGGVNWAHYVAADEGVNVYSIDIDPCDNQHLIAGLHHTPDVIESTDAGQTWTRITTAGSSIYVWFVNTGDAASTHDTWLALSETDGGSGLQRTTNGGASWTSVNSLQHAHGSSQLFQEGGIIYAAGVYGSNGSGVYKSTDLGATWTRVSPDSGQNGVYGTSKFLYSHAGGQDPGLITAPRDSDTSWTNMDHPADMTYATKRAAVTHDGAHEIIVAGNWNAGIWRYVEP
ncbi:MAG TPA: hypothetical protein VGP93_08765 [Polyangiaceae bacterium]|nr:hypothetical protein [Polyangiaceae bacterium]